MHLPHCGTLLTVPTTHRQSDVMPPNLLLYGRVHVDLARTASARCPGA
ncbi:putative leader peptide [Streptomyces sp. NPDC051020]